MALLQVVNRAWLLLPDPSMPAFLLAWCESGVGQQLLKGGVDAALRSRQEAASCAGKPGAWALSAVQWQPRGMWQSIKADGVSAVWNGELTSDAAWLKAC